MSNKRGGNIENIKVHMCKKKITIEITSVLIESRMAVDCTYTIKNIINHQTYGHDITSFNNKRDWYKAFLLKLRAKLATIVYIIMY